MSGFKLHLWSLYHKAQATAEAHSIQQVLISRICRRQNTKPRTRQTAKILPIDVDQTTRPNGEKAIQLMLADPSN